MQRGSISHALVPRRAEVGILDGPCAPLSKPLSVVRDEAVLEEAESNQTGTSQHRLELAASRRIQALVRGFVQRRRYQRYRFFVSRDLDAVLANKRAQAATQLQKHVRGMLHRVRYYALRTADEERRKEEATKKGGKKGGAKKPPAAPPAATPSFATGSLLSADGFTPQPSAASLGPYREAALLRNVSFVVAVLAYLKGSWDEAAVAADTHLKTYPAEPLTTRLLVLIRKKAAAAGGGASGAGAAAGSGGAAGGAAAAGAKKKK